MGKVDAGDDSIRRFVVRHYRYDPDRNERRHVLVAAFDDNSEFEDCLASVEAEIRARRAAGERVDPAEYASGMVRAPGDDALAANGRLVLRSLRHGVRPGRWLDQIELPRHLALMVTGEPAAQPDAVDES